MCLYSLVPSVTLKSWEWPEYEAIVRVQCVYWPETHTHTHLLYVQLEDVLKLRHILRSSTMDFALKKAALEQAALLLQGDFHEIHAMSCDFHALSCDLPAVSCDFHAMSCDFHSMSCDLHALCLLLQTTPYTGNL